MYIFSRTATIKPENLEEGLSFAVDVAARVTTVTGKPITVYNMVFGAPMGTILWSTRYDSQAEAADFGAKLAVDPGYMDAVRAHIGLFTAAPVDALASVVSSTLDPQPRPIYAITRATIANGKLAAAMAFGVKGQELVANLTGLPTAFTASVYGTFGGVAWLTGGTSMADMDALQAMQSTNEQFLALLEEAGDLFVEGSGENGLIQRIN